MATPNAATTAPVQPAGNTITLNFLREKETKNTVKYQEQERPGQPHVIGSLYIQKWAANGAQAVRVTLEFPR